MNSYAKQLIQKYIDEGIIEDNSKNWGEIIGAPITAILILLLIAAFFLIAI